MVNFESRTGTVVHLLSLGTVTWKRTKVKVTCSNSKPKSTKGRASSLYNMVIVGGMSGLSVGIGNECSKAVITTEVGQYNSSLA
jgi:hypothetical protein